MATDHLKIGARGWQHQQWSGSYYPDDLPEDWRLTYYANDFQAVLVPKEYWEANVGYELDEWRDAVSDEFRFYIECPNLDDDRERLLFETQCAQLGDSLGGLIVSNGVDVTKFAIHCPIVKAPSHTNSELCLGFLDKELDDLRAIRKWLDMFCTQCGEKQKCVFITVESNQSIAMEEIAKIKALSELMNL